MIAHRGERDMILGAVLGFSLVTLAAVDGAGISPEGLTQPPASMSIQQRTAMLRRSIRSATDCVARAVAADPRFQQSADSGEVNSLIVDSMDRCGDAMRAMIDAHDRAFGEGTGEAFFMGPYLDNLPVAIDKLVKGAHQQ
jgi:hypothetical protein